MTKIGKQLSITLWAFIIFSTGFINAEELRVAGQVISTVGKVKASAANKTERVLKRGDSFYVLETIQTDIDSKIQLKFTDGSLVNLIPSTIYRVDVHNFQDPKEQNESKTSLLQGGFRSLTGSIAKESPSSTEIRTPIATIGMRGTAVEGLLVKSTLSVGVKQGKASIANEYGEVVIGTGLKPYAICQAGRAPQDTDRIPPDLAGIASFDVENGEQIEFEVLGYQMNEESMMPTECGDAYSSSARASVVSPTIVIGCAAAIAIVAVVLDCTDRGHGHHSH